jgi:hypothetical protein
VYTTNSGLITIDLGFKEIPIVKDVISEAIPVINLQIYEKSLDTAQINNCDYSYWKLCTEYPEIGAYEYKNFLNYEDKLINPYTKNNINSEIYYLVPTNM